MIATFRVTWDGVPQVDGDFGDVFTAMAHGQTEYEHKAYDPMDDPDHVTPDMSWRLGWQSHGSKRTRLWLYDGRDRTSVHIDPAPAPEPINPFQVRIMPKAVRS